MQTVIGTFLANEIIPAQWVGSALVLALISIAMVIALFYYLNHRVKRDYFALWSIAWIFYAAYLVAAIGLQGTPDLRFFLMARRACIGISGLFMFWGSFRLTYLRRSQVELFLAIAVVLMWNLVATYCLENPYWVTIPFFSLLGAAGVYTGLAYLSNRAGYHGGSILGLGFLCWGGHLFIFPLLEMSPTFMAISYVLSAVLAIMIAIGMIIEKEVNSAEKNYRVLFDSSNDAVFLVDIWTLKILEANSSAGRLTKFPTTELQGRPFIDICPTIGEASKNVAENQETFKQLFRPFTEFYITQGDGSRTLCEGETALAEWHQRLVIQVNIRDVGERKKLGEQLRRAEKLSALGQLIAGVAHELNNPLAIVMGTTQVIIRRTGLDEALRQQLDRIKHQSERAAKIVGNLLSYARPAQPQKVSLDCNKLLADIVQQYAHRVGTADINVAYDLDEDLPRTKADTLQIEQVLTNLLSNAIDAVTDRPLPRRIKISTRQHLNSIRIGIDDNGPGISAENQTKIFDPFFTTKPLGRGTGLGLTISNSFVQEHQGKLWLESVVGKGTKFFVDLPFLPCEPEPALAITTVQESAAPSPPARQRVLIVDDEPDIVNVLKCILEDTYDVQTATNGAEALQEIDQRSYDVIISDIRMPDVDGQAMYERVKAKSPAQARKIIFVTGDTVSENTHAFLQSTGNRWLSKPFRVDDVLNLVEETLGVKTAAVAV